MMSLVHDNEMRMEGHQQGRKEGRKEGRREGRKEGRQEGRKEGRHEGEEIKLIELVLKKLDKGTPVEMIAEFLEEPPKKIRSISDVSKRIGKQNPLAVYEAINAEK